MRKKLRNFFCLMLVVGIVVLGGTLQSFAEEATSMSSKVAEVTITRLQVELSGSSVTSLSQNWTFHLALDWKTKDSATRLHAGDYFDVTLPGNMRFSSDIAAPDFDITDADGNIVAKAHVTPGVGKSGGKVHVTFTSAVENKCNIKGTINVAAKFDKTKVNYGTTNTFTATVNGDVPGYTETSHTDIVVKGFKPTNEYVNKFGEGIDGNENQVQWTSRINFSKKALDDGTLTDKLVDSEMTYIPDSFVLHKVVFDSYGDVSQTLETYTAEDLINSGKLQIAADKKSFTLNLGNTSDQYSLKYKSTYVSGTQLTNSIELRSGAQTWLTGGLYKSAESKGTISGDPVSVPTGEIKLIKVDEDGTTPLKDAVFTVTKPDGSTFELTTGADGSAVSSALPQGSYKVKEKIAPKGYELGADEYTLQVTPAGSAIQTITNKPIKTSVPVTKLWVGPKAGPVTVRLLADGTDTGKTVTLDEAGNWKGSFDGLRKYKTDGTEIVYSVKEDEVSGYTSEITGDATTGFTITNTEVPHDTPKPKEDTPKKSNRKPAKKFGGAVPYTGDSNATGIAIALASAAVVLIGGGVYLRRRDQRE